MNIIHFKEKEILIQVCDFYFKLISGFHFLFRNIHISLFESTGSKVTAYLLTLLFLSMRSAFCGRIPPPSGE